MMQPIDACFRCGYDIRGIPDDHACPECGLLCRRSRHPSDQLFDTSPRWLGRISSGVNLVLLAFLIYQIAQFPPLVYVVNGIWGRMGYKIGEIGQAFISLQYPAAVVFVIGMLRMTTAEGHLEIDQADEKLRRRLRVAEWLPLSALIMKSIAVCFRERFAMLQQNAWTRFSASIFDTNPNRAAQMIVSQRAISRASQSHPMIHLAVFLMAALAACVVPMLLAMYLRYVARRAHSAHLAEHCMIVGVGASATFLYNLLYQELMYRVLQGGSNLQHWAQNSAAGMIVTSLNALAPALFSLWALYLLARFAIAFFIASRRRRDLWQRDDRSLAQ